MENKIKVAIIVEMMGRPAEHLKKTMEDLLEVLSKEKGVSVIKKEIHELKKVDNKENSNSAEVSEEMQMWSTFAEIELNIEGISNLMRVCFNYMPSHIEIIEPSGFVLSNYELNSITNDIVSKLHNYDAIAKSAIMQNQMLAEHVKELIRKSRAEQKDRSENDSEVKKEE